MSNLIVLNDRIGYGESSTEIVREKLDSFQGQPATVEINSPGGSLFEGLEIFHMFKNYFGFITMHIVSMAASMASIIPLAGNKIITEETTAWVIHNVFGGEWGDYRDLQKEADVLKSLRDMVANLYSKRMNLDIKEIKRMMDDETWFFGEEISNIGLADETIMLPEKDDKENRSDSIAYAKIRIEECNKKIRLENRKHDFEKVALLIKKENKIFENKVDKNNVIDVVDSNGSNPAGIAGKNKKREVSKMTLEELKNESPGLYNEIFEKGVQAGIRNENDRVMAHLMWVEDAPKAVMEAIEKNEKFSDKHSSFYQKALMNKTAISNRVDDNPDDIDPKGDIDEDKVVNDMTDDILSRMKKGMKKGDE